MHDRLRLYLQLIRWDRPAGWLLLLWPTLSALWLAAEGFPGWHLVAVFTLGTVLMRSAGCCINDVADREFDKHVKRTAQRPVTSGAVSAEELAHAKAQLAAAQAALSGAREQTSRNRVLVDNSELRSNPQVMAAAAQLRAALLGKQRNTIIAPTSGYIAKRNVQLGQRIAAGTPLMAIIPLDEVWVDANFKEDQLRQLRLGQSVKLHSELYGKDVTYHGTLESLGMGTGSAFSILPAQNASGNWIKIVQRIPVRITLDKKELHEHPLRLGLSMSVDVNLHDKGNGLLPTAAASTPTLTTTAYAKQLGDADAVIDRIITENLGTSGAGTGGN